MEESPHHVTAFLVSPILRGALDLVRLSRPRVAVGGTMLTIGCGCVLLVIGMMLGFLMGAAVVACVLEWVCR